MRFTPIDLNTWSRGQVFYYFPSVEAGKFIKEGERVLMPLSLTCHHAATDGWHIHKFLESLQKKMNDIVNRRHLYMSYKSFFCDIV